MLATTNHGAIAQHTPALVEEAESFGLSVEDYLEMMGEQELTRTMLPLWRFNGQDGVYVDKGKQPYNADDHVKELKGVILGVTYSQIWLRPFNEPEKYTQNWLCLSGDKRKEPRLHPELTEEERAMVASMGAGVGCMACPAAQWSGDKGEIQPLCSSGVRLFFLTSDNEPILLAFGGMSGVDLDKFLSLNFKNKRKPWVANQVIFGRLKVNEPGKSFYKATFTLGEAVDKSMIGYLAELRKNHLENFERTQEAEPVEAMHDVAPSAPDTEENLESSGLTFDADGNPLFDDPGF